MTACVVSESTRAELLLWKAIRCGKICVGDSSPAAQNDKGAARMDKRAARSDGRNDMRWRFFACDSE